MKFADDALQESNKNPELEAVSKNEKSMKIVNDEDQHLMWTDGIIV